VTSSHSHTNRLDLMTCDPRCHRHLVPQDRGRAELERRQNSEMSKVKGMKSREGECMLKKKAQGRVKLSYG
jgi:hypothetical protein